MNDRVVVGIKPWLPWPLSRMAWWTEPVRAERLAALRIGVSLVLLLDVLWHYLPYAAEFLGANGLGGPEVFAGPAADRIWDWSLPREIPYLGTPGILLSLWTASAVLLLVGAFSRFSALVAWLLAVSVHHFNPFVVNSGDNVRNTLLFYLMLCPCGTVWSVDAWWARRRVATPLPSYVYPWPLRLLFVQLVVLYFMTGLIKLVFPEWARGTAMHYHLANLAWTRWPYEQLPFLLTLAPFFTWITLAWELGFPVLVFLAWTRQPALCLGVLFHLGTVFLFQLGPFPFYMLCFYLPLVPWERYVDRRQLRAKREVPPSGAAVASASESPAPNGAN